VHRIGSGFKRLAVQKRCAPLDVAEPQLKNIAVM